MTVKNRAKTFVGKQMRLFMNEIPATVTNSAYNFYSRVYKGQIRLGLPVTAELIQTQEKIRNRAAAKLALTLYHIYFDQTGTRIPRREIKMVLLDELEKKRLHLLEDVVLLSRDELEYLSGERFNIPKKFFTDIKEAAKRRRILQESLQIHREPAYFQSDIDEREMNGRGDYEYVFYRNYTEDGREIGFRRLASIEEVSAGDARPSVTLVPGFANNSKCFDINNRYSIAKDLADMGFWTYLFDPRGMGINKGHFDQVCTVDTLIDYDLPAVVKSIHARSKGKPTVLIGHSMGGMISEFMVQTWSLRLMWDQLDDLEPEQKTILDRILPPASVAGKYLEMVRGVVSIGSPRSFDKQSHLFFPAALWLNHLMRIFRFTKVPVEEISWILTQIPLIKSLSTWCLNRNPAELNFFVCPENQKNRGKFIHDYISNAMESVPLGLGLQFLKSVYNGEGFKRMDESRLNYTKNLVNMPDDIPLFHFYGTADPLAPPTNLKHSELYPHRYKKVYHIEKPSDMKQIEILPERSQVIDFVIHGASHVDLLYGKSATEIIHPLLIQIVQKVWNDWSYKPMEAEKAA